MVKERWTGMPDYQRILNGIKQYVYNHMSQNDAAHDPEHVLRVVTLAKEICRAYPQANAFRAELLAWVHDMNDDKLQSNVGQDSVTGFLQNLSVPQEDIQFIREGLPYISYRKYPKLPPDVPLEIQIVQDADRIDAIGAVGIARTFAYGGSKNRSLENSISHFDEKLLLLYDLLNTEEARRIALPRHTFLRGFYEQYRRETDL